ncbi:MAG: hypothetical protein ACI8UD_004109 [Planctomycetota bacterium]|jgi:hypothetical protein
MFTWLRRRRILRDHRQLESLHRKLLEEARDLQRTGDIQGFAAKTDEAAAVERKIDESQARQQTEKVT